MLRQPPGPQRWRWAVAVAVVCAGAACTSPSGAQTRSTGDELAAAANARDGLVDLSFAGGTPLDPRIRGTNLPAWIGPEMLVDPQFQQLAVDSGSTLVRMPGGSWSNAYDWLACELRDPDGCFWTWAARPSDFAAFLDATDLDGMWTVSFNETAQSAAALVAFFNGVVGDDTPIGVDRDGVDWGDVGRWAELRTDGGHPDPIGIDLWEVGNEVYGARPSEGGAGCPEFGWEDVWTCDGNLYANGDAAHDGYLSIRAAMKSVDSTIDVGAVGVLRPDEWSRWGRDVIEQAGDEIDFYVIHHYGFQASPRANAAWEEPSTTWPGVLDDTYDAFGRDLPIAVTEYNLIAFADGDGEQTMTRVVNALYIADTIGQMALAGVDVANQWNLANGRLPNGTDYGLIDVDEISPTPQFHGLEVWRHAGETIFEAGNVRGVRLYPTLHTDGSVTLIALNTGAETEVRARFGDEVRPTTATVHSVAGDSLDATTMSAMPTNELSATGDTLAILLPANSLSAIDVRTQVDPVADDD